MDDPIYGDEPQGVTTAQRAAAQRQGDILPFRRVRHRWLGGRAQHDPRFAAHAPVPAQPVRFPDKQVVLRAHWSWSGPGTSGTLTVPADKDDEWAEDLWHRAYARFDTWIDGTLTELRAGRQSAPDDDVRPDTAPGGEWVRYVPYRFGDD